MYVLLVVAGCREVPLSSASGWGRAVEIWPGDGVETDPWLSRSFLWLFRSFSDFWRFIRSAVRLFLVPFGRPILLETL